MQATEAAGLHKAAVAGHPVILRELTTGTTEVTALPDGHLTVGEYVLPVRVLRGHRWVPVQTTLERHGGSLAPTAVPGDDVRISDGGTGPLASVGAGRSRMALWWPGRLPVPTVAGSQAVFHGVVPGVDLVVTATSGQAGGVTTTLAFRSPAAAASPAVARLALRVTGGGQRLAAVGSSLALRSPSGVLALSSGLTWDSVDRPVLTAGAARAAVAVAARAGGYLAQPGTGPGGAGGPAGGALVLPAAAPRSGGALPLAPPAALITQGPAAYPIFESASLSFAPITLAAASPSQPPVLGTNVQHYDEVQSACPDANHTDASGSPNNNPYWSAGVGYDGFAPYGDCSCPNPPSGYFDCPGTAYAYYQMKVPGVLDGATVVDPSKVPGEQSQIDSWETWSGSCAASSAYTVTLSSAKGSVSNSTDWTNTHSQTVADQASTSVPPDTQHSDSNCGVSTSLFYDSGCSPTPNTCPDYQKAVFNLATDSSSMIYKAAKNSQATITFRLWEKGVGTQDLYWKRFINNPYMQIYYDFKPSIPNQLKVSAGGSATRCGTSGGDIHVGSVPSGGLQIQASFSDKSSNNMNATWRYGAGASPSTWTTHNATASITAGTISQDTIPQSWLNSQPAGGVVTWEVRATDGFLTSGWASCQLKIYTQIQPAPTVSAASAPTGCPSGTPAGTIVPGCKVSFTVTSKDVATDPATEFVFSLDQNPPNSSVPAAEIAHLGSGQTSATVTITVPIPGPHELKVYAVDQGTNDTGEGESPQFVAAGDSWPGPYSSFAAALGAGASFDNQIISSAAGASGKANGDGQGNSFDESALAATGWTPGGTIVVDGATFTLPNFASSTTTMVPDNILAAGQTIDLPAGSQGSALVFLATSTDAAMASPVTTGLPAQDVTAPYVPGNSPVTGEQCDSYQADLPGSGCSVAQGEITYAGQSSTAPYWLTVPDWVTGPAEQAILSPAGLSGGQDNGSGVVAGVRPNIYAFEVPLSPGTVVTSVTLPDIGAAVNAASGGNSFPALHIFGIAVTNTTTATPGETAGSLSGGQTWTGAWASPTETYSERAGLSSTWGGQTIRTVVQVATGGSSVRLHLSNDLGWVQDEGPLVIADISVGQQGSGGGATLAATPAVVKFGDSTSYPVSIPEGADVYSDPLAMNVTAGEKLAVSIYLKGSYPYLVQHTFCTACTTYVTAQGGSPQDQTKDVTGTPYSGSGTVSGTFSDILTGVDVQTAGVPTVATLGDSVTDGGLVTSTIAAVPRVSDVLASDEIAAAAGSGGGPAFSVVDDGIQSNDVVSDQDLSYISGGPSALTMLPNVLEEPNVGTVIIDEGLEDLLQNASQDLSNTELDLIAFRYPMLGRQLNAWGISAIWASLTPCAGYGGISDPCTTGTPSVDASRMYVNSQLAGQYGAFGTTSCSALIGFACQLYVDFDCAVSTDQAASCTNPGATLQAAYNTGDDVNLTRQGYATLATAVPLSMFSPNIPPSP